MACRFAALVILYILFPVEVLAQWHMSYGKDPSSGNDIYAARLDNMKIVTHGEEVVKAKMSVMYSCIPQLPGIGTGLGMHLETIPKFSPPEKRLGTVYFYPAKITLYKKGDTKFKSLRTEISQLRTTPRLLAFDKNLIGEILRYDQLTVLFLSAWDGDAVIAKIPLKGFAETVVKAQRKCDSATLDEIIQGSIEMQKEQKKLQKDLNKMLEKLQSKEERNR